ncbi:MAG: hypothetical protein LC720_00990 [Actinobacteria bacterium]|nr:hypothetical protein [Actinomycetota bacterium]
MNDPDRIEAVRLVAGLLRLYPATWRERYADEFAAVLVASLADGAGRWRIAADVAAGALDAHVHRTFDLGGSPMPERIRRAASIAFCASVVFAIAGSAFAKMTEDPVFTTAARDHAVLGWSFDVVYAGAILAGLAVLAGALPVLGAIVREALAGRRDLRRLLLVPPGAVGAWFGLVLLVTQVARPTPGPDLAAFFAVAGSGVLAAALSVGALLAAAHRIELPLRVLRAEWLPMSALSLAMASVTVAGLVWGLVLQAQAPALFQSADGVVSTSLALTWAASVAVMGLASAATAAAALRAVACVRSRPTA